MIIIHSLFSIQSNTVALHTFLSEIILWCTVGIWTHELSITKMVGGGGGAQAYIYQETTDEK